jgi:hypothetical protein
MGESLWDEHPPTARARQPAKQSVEKEARLNIVVSPRSETLSHIGSESNREVVLFDIVR